MTIEEFWNRAFLAALTRLPVDEAVIEANAAVRVAISNWQEHIHDYVQPGRLWKDQNISGVPYDPTQIEQ
ncbi:hypothetical protein [Xanthomonas arboricola]|uniref:hypothetical protein n=1 Tax=Xanthomonas arboricola TaxID=56448 RepID=UPI0011B097F4|nr:hypothetical protein [Xanthomonas arboricola]